jgi:adenosylcobinamide kinase/adenosylcobinamide-phosphate guanylyltransferase
MRAWDESKRDDRSGTAVSLLTLVLGGARSGKSRHAETLVTAMPLPWIYVATGEPLDEEMVGRIAAHRARRDNRWRTVEAPRDLAGALTAAPVGASILVDCLTLWLSNLMLAQVDVEVHVERFEGALSQMIGSVVLVANEVGLGIVPDNALARRFRDAAGNLNQRLAVRADHVALLVAGIPLKVK